MDVLAQKVNEAKADRVVAQLRAWGYNVQWREVTDDQMVVAIDFIGNKELPWVRAFHLETIHATPPLFEKEINDWKRDIKARISKSEFSPTLHAIVVHYGAKKLHQALMEKQH